MSRPDNRKANELRPVKIEAGFSKYAEGSVLFGIGDTLVLCNTSIEETLPPFIQEEGGGRGWITAEYAMLPRATLTRNKRVATGRTTEIQRLIGRTLRSVTNLEKLGERTIIIDCDVLQADGGTRTASINGAFIALAHTFLKLLSLGLIEEGIIKDYVGAISAGVVDGEERLDLCYEEDAKAEIEMNIALTSCGNIVELQVSGERGPFSKEKLGNLYNLAQEGINNIIKLEKQILVPKLNGLKLFC